MAKKKENIENLFKAFEQEIASLESKKHKTEGDMASLSESIVALEKQQQELNKKVSELMSKDSYMESRRMRVKDGLGKLTAKLEKLKILYSDLKEV